MHPKHIKTHKNTQKLTSLTSVVRSIRSRQNPRGQVDMAMPVLLRRKATWKHETVSRIWICLPALQEYVHTSISTIMLYIYIILYVYIYIVILPTYLVLSQVSPMIQFSGKKCCSHDVSQVKSRF